MSVKAAATASAPSFGPAVVTLFGQDVPVLAMALSLAGLLIARFIAPPSSRKLTRKQEWALTAALAIVAFLVVTGALPPGPLGVGMSAVWGFGLGFSGLLVIELFGERVVAALRAIFGRDTPAA